MSDFKAKMHQIRFPLRLRPRPRWGSLQRSPGPPDLLAIFGLLLRGGREKGNGRKGEGKGRGRERKGEGKGEEGCPPQFGSLYPPAMLDSGFYCTLAVFLYKGVAYQATGL